MGRHIRAHIGKVKKANRFVQTKSKFWRNANMGAIRMRIKTVGSYINPLDNLSVTGNLLSGTAFFFSSISCFA
jgi:hypothetical protein